MSCHDIGRGMASVGRVVLDLYDKGRFDLNTAKELLEATIRGVNWCDGNDYEAAVSLAGRCAECLKKAQSPESDLIFGNSYFANKSGVDDVVKNEIVEKLYCDSKIMASILCKDCYAKLNEESQD